MVVTARMGETKVRRSTQTRLQVFLILATTGILAVAVCWNRCAGFPLVGLLAWLVERWLPSRKSCSVRKCLKRRLPLSEFRADDGEVLE